MVTEQGPTWTLKGSPEMRSGLSAPVFWGPSWIMTIFTPALSCRLREEANTCRHAKMCTALKSVPVVIRSPCYSSTGWTLTWRLLMVSPPFPMTSPALEAGTIISWTVIPGPSLWLNAGAGRPFSTISVSSLFAVLMKEKLPLQSPQDVYASKINNVTARGH